MNDLDRRLRALARGSLDRYEAGVAVDDDLAAVVDRAGQRSDRRPRGPWADRRLLMAAAVTVLVAGTVALLVVRGTDADDAADARHVTDAPTAPTDPATPTTGEVTSSPTVPGSASFAFPLPPVAERGWIVTIRPAGTVVRTCLDIVDVARFEQGEPVELGRVLPDGTWDGTVPGTVPPCLGKDTDAPLDVRVPDQLADGDYRFCIAGPSVPEGCAAVTVATTVTTTDPGVPTTVAPPSGSVETVTLGEDLVVPPGFFVRRSIETSPFFEIRSLGPDGADLGALTAEEVVALRDGAVLEDGRTIRLDDVGSPGPRCVNTPLTIGGGADRAPLHEFLDEARSFAATTSGFVVATRDDCSRANRWGDVGTLWELVTLDVRDPDAGVTVLATRYPDPAQVLFDDGTVVYATHELIVTSVSDDGRHVAVAEPYTSEDTRYHVIDAVAGGEPLELGSQCAAPGDLVGPPRFVDGGQVVVARACSVADGEVGQLHVELVSLTDLRPVWSVGVRGVAIDSYSHTVRLSARSIDGEAWALVSGKAGVEEPVTVSVVRPGVEYPLDLLGGDDYAFTPAELVHDVPGTS